MTKKLFISKCWWLYVVFIDRILILTHVNIKCNIRVCIYNVFHWELWQHELKICSFVYTYWLTCILTFSLYMNYSLRTRRLQNKISQFHQRQSSMQSNAHSKKTNVAVKHLKTRVKYCEILIPAEKLSFVL